MANCSIAAFIIRERAGRGVGRQEIEPRTCGLSVRRSHHHTHSESSVISVLRSRFQLSAPEQFVLLVTA